MLKETFAYNLLRKIKRFFNWMVLPDSIAIVKFQQEKVRQQIRNIVEEAELVLDIGSGNRPIFGFKNVIKVDFDPKCKVDVLADAHYIPFMNNTFDLVCLCGVLEHIKDPKLVINEIRRILKNKGYVYIEIPFFQKVHGAPGDFQRFTPMGLEDLCNQFLKIKSGIICGPSSAFSHILRSYLALLLSFNSKALYHFFYYYILGWFTLPIKYFDIILTKYKNAEAISFAFYYLGKKKGNIKDV